MINLRCRNWTTTEATVSGCSVVRALPASRAAACAVEATNGPAVQSLTWTPTVKNPRLKKVFPRTETGPPLSSENFQEQKRASLSTRVQIHANNWFYSMTWGTGDHLWGAVGRGSALLVVCCRIYHSQNCPTRRKIYDVSGFAIELADDAADGVDDTDANNTPHSGANSTPGTTVIDL